MHTNNSQLYNKIVQKSKDLVQAPPSDCTAILGYGLVGQAWGLIGLNCFLYLALFLGEANFLATLLTIPKDKMARQENSI